MIRCLLAVILVAAWAIVPARVAATEQAITADRVLVVKNERKLYLLRAGRVFAAYWIALGEDPIGPKTARGDGRTPEGIYLIDERTMETAFHRSLHISYPNAADLARAGGLGVSPGGGIAIHGLPAGWEPTGPGRPMLDWTNGCIAVSNHDLDEIWERVPVGTPIEIVP
jgi:murein L,D-transpeptidase YafK